MKRKGVALVALVGIMVIGGSFTSLAGWELDGANWKYKDVGTGGYFTGWKWLDGDLDGIAECYYLDETGILAVNTTVEGYTVNQDGAWTVDGVVQTKVLEQNNTSQTGGVEGVDYVIINGIRFEMTNGGELSKPDETSALWDAEAQELAEAVGKAMAGNQNTSSEQSSQSPAVVGGGVEGVDYVIINGIRIELGDSVGLSHPDETSAVWNAEMQDLAERVGEAMAH